MEDEDLFRQPHEGLLNKFTNVVKGWQYRWFVLDPSRGVLEYFLNEEGKKQKPRGAIHLSGAVVSPSDEDSQTFMVNAANGEVYRLRAQDAKERQLWVSRLRSIVQRQRDMLMDFRDPSLTASSESLHNRTSSKWSLHRNSPRSSVSSHAGGSGGMPRQTRTSATLTATQESLRNAKDILIVAEEQQKSMVKGLESLPTTGPGINSLDHDCLLLKATSQATMECLEDCLTMLQRQELTQGQRSAEELELSQSMANIRAPGSHRKAKQISVDIRTHLPETRPPADHQAIQSASSRAMTSPQRGGPGGIGGPNTNTSHNVPTPLSHDDEVADADDDADKDLGGVEEHKSIILHLLSQLKLGMDLTKVVLPTFILERRSLLEMFADFMALPHMFARIPTLPTAEARMLAVVEYYLSSFHVGRKGSLAKKPYNPILGETFHCSWVVPSSPSTSQSQDSMLNGDQSGRGASSDGRGSDRVTFVAEQVSHHPPVSAFYAECAAKRICMNASVWTKSKFLGMSIGVNMIGECAVHVLEHGETYTLTFPNAYGRSILTIPWMELGGKVLIQCAKSNYSASIVFHTKPFYGGKVHRLTAEVKNPASQTICKVNGEWNGTLEFNYSSGEHKIIDTSKQSGCPKRVRPIGMQGEYESRRLWQNVTSSLKVGDINTATEHKRYLEERQRQEKKLRMETNTPWRTKLFSPAPNNGWVYNHILKH
ncbi:oxysterol-binding protein-related protein 11-like isoform X1 [Lytechinus pictus]|uniref:oxysterol-binding protein-related protein 11-like isoform X1 n=1 Tax=Lytechinus pictus TaxID=7653 RepID=UPI0030B9D4AB